jgi:hypothetical protein
MIENARRIMLQAPKKLQTQKHHTSAYGCPEGAQRE